MNGPRKCMDKFAVDDSAEREFLLPDDDVDSNPIGTKQAAKHKCAYNQHIADAPQDLKPVPRRSILIADSYSHKDRAAEEVAVALVKAGYQTLGHLMNRTQADLQDELKLREKAVRAYAKGLRKFHFYLAEK